MAALVAAWMLGASCNDDWDTEQYTQYVSLKAPSNNSTVAQIRLKYRQDTLSRYRLPLIVSGSTMNQKDLDVHVVLDKDTLEIYNKEHYYNRTDLYFHQLDPAYYTIRRSTFPPASAKDTSTSTSTSRTLTSPISTCFHW